MKLYISDDLDLYNSLFEHKDYIESVVGLKFNWREIPDRKASRIVIKKPIKLTDKNKWESQFDWIVNVMHSMKKAFTKHMICWILG